MSSRHTLSILTLTKVIVRSIPVIITILLSFGAILACSNKGEPDKPHTTAPALSGNSIGDKTVADGPANNLWTLPDDPILEKDAADPTTDSRDVSWIAKNVASPFGPLNQTVALLVDGTPNVDELNRRINPQVLIKVNDPLDKLEYLDQILPKLSTKGYRFYFSFANSRAISSFDAFLSKYSSQLREVWIEERTLDHDLLSVKTSGIYGLLGTKVHWLVSDGGSTDKGSISKTYAWIKPPQLYGVAMEMTISGNNGQALLSRAKTAFDTCFSQARDIPGSTGTKLNHPTGAGLAYHYTITSPEKQLSALLIYLIASLSSCNVQAVNSPENHPALPKVVTFGRLSQYTDDQLRLLNSVSQLTRAQAAIKWPIAYKNATSLFDNTTMGTAGNTLPIIGVVYDKGDSYYAFTANIGEEALRVNLTTPGVKFDLADWQTHFRRISKTKKN